MRITRTDRSTLINRMGWGHISASAGAIACIPLFGLSFAAHLQALGVAFAVLFVILLITSAVLAYGTLSRINAQITEAKQQSEAQRIRGHSGL